MPPRWPPKWPGHIESWQMHCTSSTGPPICPYELCRFVENRAVWGLKSPIWRTPSTKRLDLEDASPLPPLPHVKRDRKLTTTSSRQTRMSRIKSDRQLSVDRSVVRVWLPSPLRYPSSRPRSCRLPSYLFAAAKEAPMHGLPMKHHGVRRKSESSSATRVETNTGPGGESSGARAALTSG